MTDAPFVTLWDGRRITELTKEELIEAVEILGRLLEGERKSKERLYRLISET